MKRQNTSSAVMQQRQEARDALEDFPTPMWATRALTDWITHRGFQIKDASVREPCANRGYMVAPLAEVFGTVHPSDVHDYGAGYPVDDYLFGPDQDMVDWTITNPPFRLAAEFIERALRTSRVGVAVFVRSAFLEGAGRYRDLFKDYPPTAVLQFSERVVLHRSAMRQKGEKYWDPDADNGNGKLKSASSATSYIWMVWDIEAMRERQEVALRPVAELHWIAPDSEWWFERDGDYDPRGDLR